MSLETSKQLAAKQAVTYVKDHMLVGIGTGSTVFYFIEYLIERCKQGLNIKAVSSSERSTRQAKAGGIHFADINQITSIDLTIDGADEIDDHYRMIKGGGGALLREKILASSSKQMIVIVDETKVVNYLGKQKLPVEILPFGLQATIYKIERFGFKGKLRQEKEGSLYKTDNANFIYDIFYESPVTHPEEDHLKLISIPGVIETGFFFNLAKKVIIGFKDGHIEEREYVI
jgi:ribose 5-phosphate isomerase A